MNFLSYLREEGYNYYSNLKCSPFLLSKRKDSGLSYEKINLKNMIWFILGREFKLSIAEILAVFPAGKTAYFAKDVLILDNLEKEDVLKKANNLWWTIKIIETSPHPSPAGEGVIIKDALLHDWKFKYGISIYWDKRNLKEILIKQKKQLKASSVSSRFVNKDFKNLTSAQIIWEKLVERWTDYNIINNWFWKTIWVQDINAYSKRDYSKDRDTQIGMLPPKLCQIMINLSQPHPNPLLQEREQKDITIYDPFVWLGTVLIESIHMWNKEVYGSDLNERMVEASRKNIKNLINSPLLAGEGLGVRSDILKLNAKFIEESDILANYKIDSIISEGYLWEVMTKKNISLDRIEKQRESLKSLYEKFFEWLKKVKYQWNIVICFPFWEIKWKYVYFSEIYDILDKYCEVEGLFPKDFKELETTRSGSLLYKRPLQLVGREIFKLKIKS